MFSSLVSHRARTHPDAVAVVGPRGEISYRRFDESIDKVAHVLRDALPRERSLVAVEVGDVMRKWLLLLALGRLGHVSLAMQISGPALDPGPHFLLSDRPADGTGAGRRHYLSEDWWREALARPVAAPPDVEVGWDDPAHMTVSSGTTGVPKKMIFTHRTLLRRVEDLLLSQDLGPVQGLDTRLLVTMGTATIGGIVSPLVAWTVGGATVLAHDPVQDPEKLRSLKVTSMVMATGQLKELVESLPPDFEPLPRLAVCVGGSIVTRRLAEASRRLTPNVIAIYASTEVGVVSGAPVSRLDTEANEVGFSYPWMEVEIVGADGAPLPTGEVGEVRIRTQGAVRGYEGDAEASAAAFRDGWFHPGDLGAISPGGALRIVGRVAETMNMGGSKTTPDAVEAIFAGASGVRDVAAFSVTDAYGIEEACVAIVRGDGLDEAELRTLVERNLKLGRIRVFFVPGIPRNEMGKIRRAAVRDLALAQPAQVAG